MGRRRPPPPAVAIPAPRLRFVDGVLDRRLGTPARVRDVPHADPRGAQPEGPTILEHMLSLLPWPRRPLRLVMILEKQTPLGGVSLARASMLWKGVPVDCGTVGHSRRNSHEAKENPLGFIRLTLAPCSSKPQATRVVEHGVQAHGAASGLGVADFGIAGKVADDDDSVDEHVGPPPASPSPDQAILLPILRTRSVTRIDLSECSMVP